MIDSLKNTCINLLMYPCLFLAVSVWLEYVQYSIGRMAEEGGIEAIREVFEKSITACGLHVTKGSNLWEAYREFENAIFSGLQVSEIGGIRGIIPLCMFLSSQEQSI